MRDIGYDSYNPILNLGTIFVLVFLYILRMTFVLLILFPFKKLGFIRRTTYRAIINKLYFVNGLLIFVEGYLEFLISGRLSYESPVDSVDNTLALNIIASIAVLISCVVLPLLFLWLYCKDYEALKMKKFKREWSHLYAPLKYKRRVNLLFNIFFVLRRMIFVEIAFSMGNFPSQQIQILLFMCLFSSIYVGNFSPLRGRSNNRYDQFNEFTVYVVTIHFNLY